MYSNNDFRSYSENHLEHRRQSAIMPGGGGFDANGKNTSEYNRLYYLQNKWRWGVDTVKDAAQKVLDKTDLDEKAADAARNIRDNARNAARTVRGQAALGRYNARRAVGNAANAARNHINTAIDNSNTKVDDRARDLYRNARARVQRQVLTTGGEARAKVYNTTKRAQKAVGDTYDRARSAVERQAMLTGGRARATAYNTGRKVENTVDNARSAVERRAMLTGGNARAAAYNTRRNVENTVGNARSAVKNAPANIKEKARDAIGFDERTRLREAERAVEKARVNRMNQPSTAGAYNAAANAHQKAQRDYDRTLLGKAEGLANSAKYLTDKAVDKAKGLKERVSNIDIARGVDNIKDKARSLPGAAKDLKDRATKSAAEAVNKTVSEATRAAKDILGFDERMRRNFSRSINEAAPSKANEESLRRTQRDYNRTVLGVGENAANAVKGALNGISSRIQAAYDKTPLGRFEKDYAEAREAYSKALEIYGEGSKGAKRAAERLADVAQKVVGEAEKVDKDQAYDGLRSLAGGALSRAQSFLNTAENSVERQELLSKEQKDTAKNMLSQIQERRQSNATNQSPKNNTAEQTSKDQRSASRQQEKDKAEQEQKKNEETRSQVERDLQNKHNNLHTAGLASASQPKKKDDRSSLLGESDLDRIEREAKSSTSNTRSNAPLASNTRDTSKSNNAPQTQSDYEEIFREAAKNAKGSGLTKAGSAGDMAYSLIQYRAMQQALNQIAAQNGGGVPRKAYEAFDAVTDEYSEERRRRRDDNTRRAARR